MTNWLIAVDTWVVSDATVRSIVLPGAAPNNDKVTPGIAPVTVLFALWIGTPSTVREALDAATACVKPNAGSLMVKGVAAVSELTIVRFVPFASLPALAVTLRAGVPLVAAVALNAVTAVLIVVASCAYVSPGVVEVVWTVRVAKVGGTAVALPLVRVTLLAPSVAPVGISGEVHVVPV